MNDSMEFGHEHMSPLEMGAAYALYRQGQDEQTAQLLGALQRPAATQVNVEVHLSDEDPKGIAPVNATEHSKAYVLKSWDDFIGQAPLKRQLRVRIDAARQRRQALRHVLLASGRPGVGKGHDLGTKILTPTGWRRLGDLQVGDEVIGSSGHATTITDIYDRGVLPIYKVIFSDRSGVRCDGDHIWRVQTVKGRWTTRTVRELQDDLVDSSGNHKWRVPLTGPVEHDKVELPVEPYLAGVMLGNADFDGGVISLNKKDFDIAERIMLSTRLVEYRPHTALRFRPKGALKLIRALGQHKAKSTEKYVPSIYLTAALDDRRAILAGLLDTDGGVRQDRGSAQFHTTSPQLARDVRALVESLGGTARIMRAKRGEIRVDVNAAENPFYSRRKGSLWRPAKTRGPSRSIKHIIELGEAPVRCIRVDAPDHLYVTERYLVTHNTTMARLIAQEMGSWMIEMVPPFNIWTLSEAVQQLLDGDILFIDEIHILANHGKSGTEILLKVLEDKTLYLPDGQVIELNDITVIGATTDKDKLPRTILDRFKIMPFFQEYSLGELTRIAVNFSFRHNCYDVVDTDMCVAFAEACRGTPRILEEMVLACADLALANGATPEPAEVLEFLEVQPDGLTRMHIHYLTAMFKYFPRVNGRGEIEYIAGEMTMQQILHETKEGVGRLERYLVEQGLLDKTGRGRRLTSRGITRAREFIAAGQGA